MSFSTLLEHDCRILNPDDQGFDAHNNPRQEMTDPGVRVKCRLSSTRSQSQETVGEVAAEGAQTDYVLFLLPDTEITHKSVIEDVRDASDNLLLDSAEVVDVVPSSARRSIHHVKVYLWSKA